jgi:hypothetical protein
MLHYVTLLPSRPEEFHLQPLTDPYTNLSIHTARHSLARAAPDLQDAVRVGQGPEKPSSCAITSDRNRYVGRFTRG